MATTTSFNEPGFLFTRIELFRQFIGRNRRENGNSHSLKLESSKVLNFGESKRKRNAYNGNGNILSGQSQFNDEEKKRRSPTSRGINEEGILSFTLGVVSPRSNMKIGGRSDSDPFHLEASVLRR
ncbi:hypothetical protein K1719_021857 [Acacia pycnantha]|nr:hypothetical protein K1719_021857 [Acacia pycnantha]